MDFIFIIVVVIMSVVVHEVSHGLAALALGDPTAKYQGRLTLNPIKHLDPVGSVLVPLIGYLLGGFVVGWAKPVPFNPYNLRNARWGEALVAIAGPLSNFFLAIVFGLVIRIAHIYGFGGDAFISISAFIVLINITLGIFNLIPIPPLDGSKILFAILPNSFMAFRGFLEQFGVVFALLFAYLFWQLLSPVVQSIFSLITGLNI